jgi:ER-bound oxygenase mpaB/B'/Rubber oxygenase, catalytic domain
MRHPNAMLGRISAVRQSRYLAEIRRLDPERDHLRIVYLDSCFEFPLDTTLSLQLAFFRTYAVPTIGGLLDSTREFALRAQQRYDDTELLIAEFVEYGYDSARGRAAVRQMNRIHARHPIANDDNLYVLSAMVLEPIRWNERFGWRPLLEQERLAGFHFWRRVGGMMAMDDIPETLAELDAFNRRFEDERFAYTEEGRRVGIATLELFVSWFPWLPRQIGRRAIYALLDDRLLDAFGFPHPTAAERRAVEGALRARARVVRLLPPRRKPRLRTELKRRSYPRGYRIEELGPPVATAE